MLSREEGRPAQLFASNFAFSEEPATTCGPVQHVQRHQEKGRKPQSGSQRSSCEPHKLHHIAADPCISGPGKGRHTPYQALGTLGKTKVARTEGSMGRPLPAQKCAAHFHSLRHVPAAFIIVAPFNSPWVFDSIPRRQPSHMLSKWWRRKVNLSAISCGKLSSGCTQEKPRKPQSACPTYSRSCAIQYGVQ